MPAPTSCSWLTEWPEYTSLDPKALGAHARQRNVIDARNALDPDRWQPAGWTYRALGRPQPRPAGHHDRA